MDQFYDLNNYSLKMCVPLKYKQYNPFGHSEASDSHISLFLLITSNGNKQQDNKNKKTKPDCLWAHFQRRKHSYHPALVISNLTITLHPFSTLSWRFLGLTAILKQIYQVDRVLQLLSPRAAWHDPRQEAAEPPAARALPSPWSPRAPPGFAQPGEKSGQFLEKPRPLGLLQTDTHTRLGTWGFISSIVPEPFVVGLTVCLLQSSCWHYHSTNVFWCFAT